MKRKLTSPNKKINLFFLLSIPGIAFADGGDIIAAPIDTITGWITDVVGVSILILIVGWTGIRFIISKDKHEREEAKAHFIWAAIGAAILFGSSVIAQAFI